MEKWLILGGILLVLSLVAECIRELTRFQVTRYEIGSPKLAGMQKKRKVIVLGDLHNQTYGKDNERLLDAIRAEQPDLILVTGDMLIGVSTEPAEVACKFMMELPKIARTYHANGNHEQRMKARPEFYQNRYEEYKQCLEQSGVICLENAQVEEEWDGRRVRIRGLEIPLDYYQKWKRQTMKKEVVEEAVGVASDEAYEILLAHNPTYMDAYLEWGADLVLSGHFHGGVVRIPGIGAVITPQYHLFPKYSGEHTQVGEASVVVSKGLGVHTLRLRLCNPAEMIVLQIGGK